MSIYSIDLSISGDGDFAFLSLDYFEIITNFKPFANIKILELVESFITADRGFTVSSRHLDIDNEFRIRFSMDDMPGIDSDKSLYSATSTLNEKIISLFPYKFFLDKVKINYIICDIAE